MTKFLYSYHGGAMPETPQDGEKILAAWRVWLKDVGSAFVDVGNPTKPAKLVLPDGKVTAGGSAAPVTGYSVVEARDADHAAELARGCPIFMTGGSIEVGEVEPFM